MVCSGNSGLPICNKAHLHIAGGASFVFGVLDHYYCCYSSSDMLEIANDNMCQPIDFITVPVNDSLTQNKSATEKTSVYRQVKKFNVLLEEISIKWACYH